jgi:ubiquinone/menaquinone biosynthesis C-methylase UbiE
MNAFENWFCASPLWRYVTQRKLLPWILQDADLGEHVLELGAGPGAATQELQRRCARVTSLDYNHKFAAELYVRQKLRGSPSVCEVVQGDASSLPFATSTFSSAIAVLMLHHLRSNELQDRALAEIFRVLRPGGVFLAFEIEDSWLHRVGHVQSTFVPLVPTSVFARLESAGFSRIAVDHRRGGFRVRAQCSENS